MIKQLVSQSGYSYSTIKQAVTLCPESNTKTSIRFKFTPKTVISNVLIRQVCCEASQQ